MLFRSGLIATILTAEFVRKVAAIMASKTLKPDDDTWCGRRIDMAEYGRTLAKYRAEVEAKTGRPLDVLRNSGKRRTASKKALLEAIAATGKVW